MATKVNLVEEEIRMVVIKIRGVITEPKCWSAKYFGNFAVNTAPKRYSMDVRFLFEMEWLQLVRDLMLEDVDITKPGSSSDNGCVQCAIWMDEQYIGDDLDLGNYLNHDGYINQNLIYQMLNVNVRITKDPLKYCPRNLNRSYVVFNVVINGKNSGRMLFELFNDLMPLSCQRFLKECKRYEGCPVHRIVKNGWFESGQFDKEEAPLREKRSTGLNNCREGMLSLVNFGKCNKKSSQFLVTIVPAPQLDPYQCPIGTLLDGGALLNEINDINTHYDAPLARINLAGVVIYYVPTEVGIKHHLNCQNPVDKPADIWLEEEIIKKDPKDEQLKKYRLDIEPDFTVKTTDLDENLKEIKRQLFEENNKLIEIIDDTELKQIIDNVLKKQLLPKSFVFNKKQQERMIEDALWYRTLINAKSEFSFIYAPKDLPKLCENAQDLWLKKSATIHNPMIRRVLIHMKNKDVNMVICLINRMIQKALEETILNVEQTLYPKIPMYIDYKKPLGDDIDRLPESIQDILINEVCNLPGDAFELFGITLKHILNTVSETVLEEASSISGNVMTLINMTKSYLDIENAKSKIDVFKKKDTLQKDFGNLTKSIFSIFGPEEQKSISGEIETDSIL